MKLDTGFRPSKHGFGFANSWRDLLFGVLPSRGRCGGMVFAALDAFAADAELAFGAGSPSLPEHDAAVSQLIWRRQVDSVAMRLGTNLWQFARFTYLPSGAPGGIGETTRRELLPVFDMLRSGRPVPLGLVSAIAPGRLASNHQVLAYAGDFGEDDVILRIYDPNHPLRDDVTLHVSFALEDPVTEHIGAREKRWRGFFIEHYSPKRVAGYATKSEKYANMS